MNATYRRNAAIALTVSAVLLLANLIVWTSYLHAKGVSIVPQHPLVGEWSEMHMGYRTTWVFDADGAGRFDSEWPYIGLEKDPEARHFRFQWYTSGNMITLENHGEKDRFRFALSGDRRRVTFWRPEIDPRDYERR